MCSWFDVNMVAERRSIVLGSLSGESVEHVVQRAKSSENEDVTTTEDTVEYMTECRPEIVREPDYLKFLAESEKEAVDPEQYLDMKGIKKQVRLRSFLTRSQQNLLEMRLLTW